MPGVALGDTLHEVESFLIAGDNGWHRLALCIDTAYAAGTVDRRVRVRPLLRSPSVMHRIGVLESSCTIPSTKGMLVCHQDRIDRMGGVRVEGEH